MYSRTSTLADMWS